MKVDLNCALFIICLQWNPNFIEHFSRIFKKGTNFEISRSLSLHLSRSLLYIRIPMFTKHELLIAWHTDHVSVFTPNMLSIHITLDSEVTHDGSSSFFFWPSLLSYNFIYSLLTLILRFCFPLLGTCASAFVCV